MVINRVLCWFSCGVTSAVASKLALDKYRDSEISVVIAYCDTGSEHKDNKRFLKDCEKWYNFPITILKNPKFDDIYKVFDYAKFISSKYGARCSLEMKKIVRQRFENLAGDLQVFGFNSDEAKRSQRFNDNNPEVTAWFPLIEQGITKSDCIEMVQSVGIELPVMYKLGYKNNNCIGCVKGGVGYWNKIRADFPDIFEKTCRISREYGAKLAMHKGKHIYLDEIDPSWGNYKSELPISCGVAGCGIDSDEQA